MTLASFRSWTTLVAALTLACAFVLGYGMTTRAEATVKVTGRVVDKEGNAIPGAEVRIGQWGAYIGDPVFTVDDGRFVYEGVEPLGPCVATGLLYTNVDNEYSEILRNSYLARVKVAGEWWAGGEWWPEIPVCVEPDQGDTIDIGDLSRPHFWWANHHFHLVREITDDQAMGEQDFFPTWQIGFGNDGVGPIDWRVTADPTSSNVYPAFPFPLPNPNYPEFTWTGSLVENQYGVVGLADSEQFPTPQPLGFEVTRSSDSVDSVIGAHATEIRSFTLSVKTTDAKLDAIVGSVMPYNTPPGPVTVSSFNCDIPVNGNVSVMGNEAWWSVQAAGPGEHLPLNSTYELTCTMTLYNGGCTAALYKPWAGVQAMQQQYRARYLAVSRLEVESPDEAIEPRDLLGSSTFEVWPAGGNPGDGLFDVDFNRNLIRRIVFLPVNESDGTPPVIGTVTPSPDVLWPPDHKMVPVKVTADASDISGKTTCKIISIASNEPINGLGDGDTAPDWEITGDLTVNLRAERSGTGTGRVYTIIVSCSDCAGNTSNKSVIATVPKNQGKK